MTTTTVGYGVYYPDNPPARLVTIFVILVGTTMIISIVLDINKYAVNGLQDDLSVWLQRKYYERHGLQMDATLKRLLKLYTCIVGIFIMICIGTAFYCGK